MTSTGSAAPGRAPSSTWKTPSRRSRKKTALAARAYPKLVNYSTHDPTNEIERAERALAALSSEQVPAGVASVAFDLYWAELLLGHGARRELFKRWKELEDTPTPVRH